MLHFYQSNKKWGGGGKKNFPENAGANSPMGRIAEPEETGRVVMGMCDPKLTFLNGDDVKADGASSA